jgi:Domain of unknown function (DUF4105)
LKKLLFFLIFTFYFLLPAGAQDSCQLRISLLTCAPGEELYSTFGHTALRVQDLAAGRDEVYNYGTFDFGPDFYSKFIRGKLLYYLSVEEFNEFQYQYQMQSRSIQEQVLQLSCTEKQKLLDALNTNAKEENRYYRYDFLFDNCTTRAGEMVEKNTSSVQYKNILPAGKLTFRNQIHSYLDAGHQHWSKLGIDLLLGAKLDRQVSNKEAMFLPDYLLKGFDAASAYGRPLVEKPETILKMPSPLNDKSFITPTVVFSVLLLIVGILCFLSAPWAGALLGIFDFLLFFLSGLAGILLLFMWFGTDHIVCRNNYNLLWALPTNVLAAFFTRSRKKWVAWYFRFVFFFNLAILICWWFLPQQMNNALIPLLVLIILSSWYLSKKNEYAGETGDHQR